MRQSLPPQQLILCIPGPWEDRGAFVCDVLAATDGQYVFLGGLLMHLATKDVFEIEFHPRDERMLAAFSAAGPHWRDAAEMDRIASHRSVAYLLHRGGSAAQARVTMLAAQALLDAGGLGVKVETTGLAHAPEAWRRMCANVALSTAYNAFVIVVTGAGQAYSCGMHNLGMHDVRVEDQDADAALQAARFFSHYLFTEGPTIKDGQTFSCDAHSPRYRITPGDGVDYGPDSLYGNPYGTWHLQRL